MIKCKPLAGGGADYDLGVAPLLPHLRHDDNDEHGVAVRLQDRHVTEVRSRGLRPSTRDTQGSKKIMFNFILFDCFKSFLLNIAQMFSIFVLFSTFLCLTVFLLYLLCFKQFCFFLLTFCVPLNY